LEAPQPEILDDFEAIRTQLSSMMDEVEIPALNGYLVTSGKLDEVLAEFSRLGDYRSKASQTGSLFAGLGLADTVLETDSLIQNMWADPNGTLLFFDSSNVLIMDFDVSQYQRYSYAQALVQNYRNRQDSYEDMGIYPMCSPVNQACEILYALSKGEAAFFAEMWAVEYMGETAYQEFSQEPVNQFTVSAPQNLSFLEASLSLPDSFGVSFVDAVYDDGGLQAVGQVYSDLPETTEQLMHPEKYFTDEAAVEVAPVDISESLGVSWMEVYQGVLGEWKTFLLLAHPAEPAARLAESAALNAADGWGGDFAQIYFRNSTQEYVVVVEWAWDSPADSGEFYSAFSQSLRFKSGTAPQTLDSGASCYETGNGFDCTYNHDGNILWLHAPDLETIELLLSFYQ
jgi:hypothetical protein